MSLSSNMQIIVSSIWLTYLCQLYSILSLLSMQGFTDRLYQRVVHILSQSNCQLNYAGDANESLEVVPLSTAFKFITSKMLAWGFSSNIHSQHSEKRERQDMMKEKQTFHYQYHHNFLPPPLPPNSYREWDMGRKVGRKNLRNLVTLSFILIRSRPVIYRKYYRLDAGPVK